MSEPLPPLPLHELRPFLHGIQADPEDDLALRALGDWLEEIGDVRAELVRAGLYGDLTAVRRWSSAHGPAWWGKLPDGVRLEVRRGLIELVWPTRQLAASQPPLSDRLLEMMAQGWVFRVVIEGAALGTIAPWAAELLGQVTAIRWDQATNGGLRWLPPLPLLRELDLCKSVAVSADGLAYLDRFPGLWRLYLSGCEALAEASLAGFAELRHVRLGWNPRLVGVSLRDLPQLRVLSLTMNDRFRVLRLGELPRLRELSLRGCPELTDGDLAALAGLTALETLDLDGCVRLQGAGLAHLGGLPNLRELVLSGCAALRRVWLAKMPRLQTLDLGMAGVEELTLSQLANLDRIDLFSTRAMRSITLSDLPRLERVPVGDWRELRRLTVEDVPLLRSLNLRGLRWLTDLRLQGVEGLRQLDLRDCTSLSAARITELKSRLVNCKVLG